jgi:hypothetical protein
MARVASTRAPNGSKAVTQAFLTALDDIPEARQAAVAGAAQLMIREALKTRRSKIKSAAMAARAQSRPAPSRRRKVATAADDMPKRGRGRPRKVQPTPEPEPSV